MKITALRRLLILPGLLLALTSQPAFANDTNGDVPEIATAATTAALQAITVAQNALSNLQHAFAAATQAAGQFFQTRIATMLSDNNNVNTRNTSNLAQLQQVAVQKEVRAGYSYCTTNTSTDTKIASHDQSGNMAVALTQGQKGRPGDSTGQASDLQMRCQAGLLNLSSTTDQDAATYKRLFPGSTCPAPSGASSIKPGSDKTILTVLKPREYLAPDNFTGVQSDGSYQLLKPPFTGSGDHSAFVAAYATCQGLTKPQPTLRQNTGSGTVGDLTVSSRRNAQLRQTAGDTCWMDFGKRIQYSSSNPTPAIDQFGNTTTAYKLQYARCQEDFGEKLITQDQVNLCQQNGRSDLQADYDRAYRLSSKSAYNAGVLPTLSADMQEQLKAQAWAAEDAFDMRLQMEYATLILAISSDNGISTSGTSAMDAAVQSQ